MVFRTRIGDPAMPHAWECRERPIRERRSASRKGRNGDTQLPRSCGFSPTLARLTNGRTVGLVGRLADYQFRLRFNVSPRSCVTLNVLAAGIPYRSFYRVLRQRSILTCRLLAYTWRNRWSGYATYMGIQETSQRVKKSASRNGRNGDTQLPRSCGFSPKL